MAKKDFKDALKRTVAAEKESVQKRLAPLDDKFARAEAAMKEIQPEQEQTKSKAAQAHEKVVRDSFTMPQNDYDLISTIREKCLKSGISLTKGEVLRAGLHALKDLSAQDLKETVKAVEKIKPGRPPGE